MWLWGTAVAAWHGTICHSRAQPGQGAAKRLMNPPGVFEQAGGMLLCLVFLAPPASLPAVQLFWLGRTGFAPSLSPTSTPERQRVQGRTFQGPMGTGRGFV